MCGVWGTGDSRPVEMLIVFQGLKLYLLCAALKIHMSQQTREVLDEFNCFVYELRGEVEMKVS